MANYYTQMSTMVTGTDGELSALQATFDLFDEYGDELTDWDQEDFNSWIERVNGFEVTEMSKDRATFFRKIAEQCAGTTGVQTNIEELDGKKFVYIRSDESVDIDAVAHILNDWLSELGIDRAVQIEWANTASKAIPGGFGGGAAHITAKGIEWMETSNWLTEMRKKSEPEEVPEP